MSIKQTLFKTGFVLGTTFWCIVGGGFLGGRILTPPGAMGWDALANVLGGMMVGGLLGLILSIILTLFLKGQTMLMAYWVSGSIFMITLLVVVVRIIIVSGG
jgi:hypothetical protein